MQSYKEDDFRVPVRFWLKDMSYIEGSCQQQIANLAQLPFIFNHLAIMPDTHAGYGMPIGGVLATEGVVIPNAVGVDIGCGMCAVKTSIKYEELNQEYLKLIMCKIRKSIPVGKAHHKEKQGGMPMPTNLESSHIVMKNFSDADTQVGTLGGGNHFIEIQKDNENYIWIMIHSGSRNLGYKVANYYNKIAIGLNEKWHSKVPKEWGLAFLPLDSEEGIEYLNEMNYCVEFALANRTLMMLRICDIISEVMKLDNGKIANNEFLKDFHTPMINIAHNYAQIEHHFGKDIMVHRKGATLARHGTVGIIPGSQGTKSYIVEGRGNIDSFNSCSHGAGRLMSRTKAQETLNLEDEIKKMDDKGIIHGIRSKKDLDEAAGSYKDIDTVMEDQKDLVLIIRELTPIAVIKG